MSLHPFNLAVRFLLEIAALVALGYWGIDLHPGVWHFVLGLGLPLLAAAAWGIFAATPERRRSDGAPVPVPGWAGLLLPRVVCVFVECKTDPGQGE